MRNNDLYMYGGIALIAVVGYMIASGAFSVIPPQPSGCSFTGTGKVTVWEANDLGGRINPALGTFTLNAPADRTQSFTCNSGKCAYQAVGTILYSSCRFYDASFNVVEPGNYGGGGVSTPTATARPTTTAVPTTPPVYDCRVTGCTSGATCQYTNGAYACQMVSIPTATANPTYNPTIVPPIVPMSTCQTIFSQAYSANQFGQCPYSVAVGVDDWVIALGFFGFIIVGGFVIMQPRMKLR